MEAQKLNANPIVKTQAKRAASRGHDPSLDWLEEQFAEPRPGGGEGGAGAGAGDVDMEDAHRGAAPGAADAGAASGLTTSGEAPREAFTAEEIYALVKDIRDPEHPLSLAELNVVSAAQIAVDDAAGSIELYFTPTVPHCSMSTLIGLCLRVKLLRSLPPRFKVDIYVEPGSHVSEAQVNKQLNDKERVAAALENGGLVSVVNKCLTPPAALSAA